MYFFKNIFRIFSIVCIKNFAEQQGERQGETDGQKAESTDMTEGQNKNLTTEQQEKLEALKKEKESIKGGMKYLSQYRDSLKTGKEGIENDGSPKDEEDIRELAQIQARIDNLEKQYTDLKLKGENIDQELGNIGVEQRNIKTDIEKMEFSMGVEINESGEISKLTMNSKELASATNEDFLKIPEKERLKYITKDNIDSERVASGEVNDIEFNFNYEGKRNDVLYMYTTAGQVLPNEVRSVSSQGKSYERIGVNGEFYNGKERLIIDTGTKITVEKLGTPEEIAEMDNAVMEKYQNYIKENPKFAEEQYKSTIIETFKKGLGNKELGIILNESYSEINNLDIDEAKKLLVVTRHLDNSGYLGSYIDAGELIKNLQEIIGVIDTYGKGLRYSVNDKGEINFELGSNGIPEGLDIEPSLEKFVKIGLSQIGTHESTGQANKYLGGKDARSIPWCAGFVNWCLEQAGYRGTGSLAAKSFINGSGYGHAGIKLGNKILGGNQSDMVSLVRINKPIAGWAIPTKNGLEIHKPAGNPNEIPDGAIIVFDRNPQRDRRYS